ncbi:MAG: sulfite exporter TauE/SafE family protein, partial [Nitrospirae bacterium]|nr:sulfite exporter TauE/SafE family protein [Nitrospirota bacterium]
MSINDSIYFLMFSSGLFGGFGHCIGMCGPLVAAYSMNLRNADFLPHLLYNSGRIITYTIIGGIMGLTGSFVGVIRVIERFQDGVMLLIGVLMVLMGASIGGWLPFAKKLESGKLSGRIINTVRFISESRGVGVFFPMGLIL